MCQTVLPFLLYLYVNFFFFIHHFSYFSPYVWFLLSFFFPLLFHFYFYLYFLLMLILSLIYPTCLGPFVVVVDVALTGCMISYLAASYSQLGISLVWSCHIYSLTSFFHIISICLICTSLRR
jgi:hypothetical protein